MTSPQKAPTGKIDSRPVRGNNLSSLARYIESDKCKKIVLMLGAGVSTSAGIPDFRSPETGLYANLARLNLPYPEAVFEINFFKRNPKPFYTLAHELYPGKYRPTITHSFIKLLADHSLLHLCFTQNIDTLERRAGVPSDKIIEAHGSFASQRCVSCKKVYEDDKMKEKILAKEIAKCEHCRGGIVKPDIVFFGESLPDAFIESIPAINEADLLIVIGTSLTVHPFASLAYRVSHRTPRVLINLDRVGDFGTRKDDVVLLGKCDDIVASLCQELGWGEELDSLWAETALPPPTTQDQAVESPVHDLEADIEEITAKVGSNLALEEVVKDIHDKQVQSTENKVNGGPSVVQGQPLPDGVEEVTSTLQDGDDPARMVPTVLKGDPTSSL